MDRVRGLDQFRKHFAGNETSYTLIGGVACDILLGEAGLPFRTTRDFDMVLCVEVVSKEFGMVFARFLELGGYQARERSTGRREFYRFHRPLNDAFPTMIELFAHPPCNQLLPKGVKLSPISVEEEVISLSAILLDRDYFKALKNMRRIIGDVCLVDERILIPFKARAFLDLARRKMDGENIDSRVIRKHRADAFRLIQLLPASDHLLLADPIRDDLTEFIQHSRSDPDFKFKALGLSFSLVEAITILKRFYRLDKANGNRMP